MLRARVTPVPRRSARINNPCAAEVGYFCHTDPKPGQLIRAAEVDPRGGRGGRGGAGAARGRPRAAFEPARRW